MSQGKRLRSGEKSIVINVQAFFEKEKAQGKSIMRERVIDRIASATGIGKTAIKRISKEFQSKGEFETPKKRYKRSRVRINLDDFSTDIIRREIHAAYTRKEYPTLDSLQKKLLDKQVIYGGRSTLHKIIREIGFRYKKSADGKLYVYEQPRVTQQRHDYLRSLRKNRNDKRPVVLAAKSLLPQVPSNSIIVMDNAKYHNTVVEKVPTKSSTKKVMQTWLERHQIEYERSDMKRNLLRRIQAVNAKTLYKTVRQDCEEIRTRSGEITCCSL